MERRERGEEGQGEVMLPEGRRAACGIPCRLSGSEARPLFAIRGAARAGRRRGEEGKGGRGGEA